MARQESGTNISHSILLSTMGGDGKEYEFTYELPELLVEPTGMDMEKILQKMCTEKIKSTYVNKSISDDLSIGDVHALFDFIQDTHDIQSVELQNMPLSIQLANMLKRCKTITSLDLHRCDNIYSLIPPCNWNNRL